MATATTATTTRALKNNYVEKKNNEPTAVGHEHRNKKKTHAHEHSIRAARVAVCVKKETCSLFGDDRL